MPFNREKMVAEIADVILKEVINPRIKAQAKYMKHLIEFTPEMDEAIEQLDVLEMYAKMMLLLKGQNESEEE